MSAKLRGKFVSTHMGPSPQAPSPTSTNTSRDSYWTTLFQAERLPPADLGYFRARFTNAIHQLVLERFLELQAQNGFKRADLARRIRTRPEQVTRWLSSPGNWELETLSDMLLGMGCEPVLTLKSLPSETTTSRRSRGFDLPTMYSTQTPSFQSPRGVGSQGRSLKEIAQATFSQTERHRGIQ